MTKETRIISAFGQGIKALEEPKNCRGFIGVSLDYPFFQETDLSDYLDRYLNSKNLESYLKWSSEVLGGLMILTSDWLLHYNLMAFEGMEEMESLGTAHRMGNFLEERCQEALARSGREENSYFRWPAFSKNYQESELIDTINKVREFSRNNEKFKQHCLDLTLTATFNKLKIIKKRHGKKKYQETLSLATDYAVDDLALMFHFYKQGLVSVSKYEPPKPIKQFLYGSYPELCEILDLRPNKVGHIQAIVNELKIYDQWYDDKYERLAKLQGDKLQNHKGGKSRPK